MSKEVTKERFETISVNIKSAIKTQANEKALARVIEVSLEKEVEARTQMILAGTEAWLETRKSIDKCQPDIITYPVSLDGKEEVATENAVAAKAYSAEKNKELQGLKKKLGELDAALLLALGEAQDYNKLKGLIPSKK